MKSRAEQGYSKQLNQCDSHCCEIQQQQQYTRLQDKTLVMETLCACSQRRVPKETYYLSYAKASLACICALNFGVNLRLRRQSRFANCWSDDQSRIRDRVYWRGIWIFSKFAVC